MTIILSYIPALHQGYWQFLKKHQGADVLYLLSKDLIGKIAPQIDYLHKDIRALSTKQIQQALQAWQIKPKVEVLNLTKLTQLKKQKNLKIIAPSEDITRQIITQFLPQAQVTWDSIFLRWNKSNVLDDQKIKANTTLSSKKFDQTMIKLAQNKAQLSSDWWRQVGAVLISKQGQVIASGANRHQPSDQTPYIFGDTRGLFHKGQHIELSTAAHAESTLIAQCAQQGIALAGASLYVTDFPCPFCARMIAVSGINKLYYLKGYAVMDGQTLLKQAKIQIIKVNN